MPSMYGAHLCIACVLRVGIQTREAYEEVARGVYSILFHDIIPYHPHIMCNIPEVEHVLDVVQEAAIQLALV